MNPYITTTPMLVKPLTYQEYRSLIEELIEKGLTTGEELTEQKIAFTKLNLQRMKRVEKQFAPITELETVLSENRVNWKWKVLAEAWCGDGAQVIPAIYGIADMVPGIEFIMLLRDENPELMDTCLTNGSRAIPILICEDAETGERVFTWGPRPEAIKEKVNQFKAENPDADHEALVLQLHLWYAKDRSLSLQQDMLRVLQDVFANKQMLNQIEV